jgi:sensor c-di-GMP phosphodiesterase-like protein
MMRALKQRVLVTFVATLVAAAFGLLAGYWIGREIALRLTESKLKQYATLTMKEADASSRESRTMLAAMNASTFSYCSEAEIAWFRKLLFQSEYLKEAGRMRGGRIECSATLGRLAQPVAQPQPGFSQMDGTKVYKGFAPFRVDDLTVVSLELGDSYVIFSPYIEARRGSPPLYYISTATDDPSRQSVRLKGAPAQANAAILTSDGNGYQGNNLYATRCSARYFNCVTAYISIPEALLANRGEMKAMLALGGPVGGLLGFIVALLYRRNRSLDHQLRRAIQRDRLRVVYQPIVNLDSGEIVGAEALARWTNDEGFAVGPDVFVKVAEERGFVGEITRLVVRHVLQDFAETLRANPDFRISINVAAADLGDPRFLPMLEQSMDREGVSAASVMIESTESSTALHQVAMEAIRHLRRLGHHVHIDDFGTGYSSLSYLHDLSVDAIKIDQSFTRAIGTQAVTVSILPQILAMAEALNLQVIVEGIETSQQAGYFSGRAKSILGQGWFFGHPVPPEEFLELMAAPNLLRPKDSSSEQFREYATEVV